jgi:hypothetical protein
MTNETKWRLAPPTVEDIQETKSEFWYRRLWAVQEEGEEPAVMLDVYQVIYTPGDEEYHLMNNDEVIALNEIGQADFVEWAPVPSPEGETVCTEYAVLRGS